MVRQRKGAPKGDVTADGNSQDEPKSDLSHKPTPKPMNAPFSTDPTMKDLSQKTQWLLLAVGSGACAAFNGVFAKLTTTELTTTWAKAISSFLGLQPGNGVVEYGIRGIFFGLNLLFNGIMWALFTAALTKGTSTTQVSIVNVSSNFMITAILGFAIFYEALPPLWWLGAALLVVGNVIIGRREEQETTRSAGEGRIALDERTIVTRVEHELEEEQGLLGDMHMKSLDGDIEVGTDIDNPVE